MTWNRVNRVSAILVVCFVIVIAAKRYLFDENKINNNHQFTVATVYNISYPAEGGPDADYEYCVNNILYRDFISFNPKQRKIVAGSKFLLKYYPPNPKIARILLDSIININVQIDTCGNGNVSK